MALHRVQVGLNDAEFLRLQLYSEKRGFTNSGALRYCFLREADEEGIPAGMPKMPSRKRKREPTVGNKKLLR